jgi:hypothetical protein
MPITTKLTIADKPINATYENVTGLTGGTDLGATFDVTKTDGVYTVVMDSSAGSAGSGYAPGNTVTIKGSDLGGVDGTNDLIVTVATIGAGGKIATYGAVGTGRVGDGDIDVLFEGTGTSAKAETFLLGGKKFEFNLSVTSKGVATVTHPVLDNVSLVLTDVERLAFSDKTVAFDVKGDAGEVYALLAAAFGNGDVTEKLLGKYIAAKDSGKTDSEVAQLILNSKEYKEDALGSSNETFVKQVYKNVTGETIGMSDLEYFTGILDRKEISQPDLLEYASNLEFFRSEDYIDLVGMTTITYVPEAI